MIRYLENLSKIKVYLILTDVLLVSFLILLSNLEVIPLQMGDFIFFASLLFALALYRPGWAFLLFISLIPLENINLAPDNLRISVRPYQFLGALIVVALLIRKLSGRLNFKLIKPKWFDYLVIIMAASGFLSSIPGGSGAIKLSIIFTSFATIYFLVRNYVQSNDDLRRIIPFYISSSIIVTTYSIWQNIRFLHRLPSFEVMPGRPNATFPEADWLGIYMILAISVIYGIAYHFSRKNQYADNVQISNLQFPISKNILAPLVYVLLCLSFIVLILTVSRSAWLGAFAATFIFLFIFFTDLRFRRWCWFDTLKLKMGILSSIIVAILTVSLFHLTNFQLLNRARSAGSGLQKITISCEGDVTLLPEKIANLEELSKFDCRHINLEEIETEKAKNHIVTEAYRDDPNVSIRSEIYRRSWNEIKNHPVLGIGWGNIGKVLGTDERGMDLNSSNIFLEVWLGSGILGFLCFMILLGHILFRSLRNYYFSDDHTQKTINLFIIASWFGLVVSNLFNAGIFLAFFWVWLAIGNSAATIKAELPSS